MIPGAGELGEYAMDRIAVGSAPSLQRQKPVVYEENRGKSHFRYLLCGLGGMTLDNETTPPKPPPKTPEPAPPQPAASEILKEQKTTPPAQTLTPQPKSKGLGSAPPYPPVIKGRKHEQVKQGTGAQKPIASKNVQKKQKEKTKAAVERAKTTKETAKQRPSEKVEKALGTNTSQERAPVRHPTSVDVMKSLGAQGGGRYTPAPNSQRRATPPPRTNTTVQPGTPGR